MDLAPLPPSVPTLSVGRSSGHRTAGIVVRQVADLRAARVVTWRRVPCTNPLRTLVDFAGVATAGAVDDAVDDAVDRALAARLVTVEGLLAEIARLARSPAGMEVSVGGDDGRYRLDVVLSSKVALEVDGYCYHAGPDVMGRDLRRHNDLGIGGWVVLRYTWIDVVRHGDRLLAQVGAALQRFG